jgi:hypothetical protein
VSRSPRTAALDQYTRLRRKREQRERSRAATSANCLFTGAMARSASATRTAKIRGGRRAEDVSTPERADDPGDYGYGGAKVEYPADADSESGEDEPEDESVTSDEPDETR